MWVLRIDPWSSRREDLALLHSFLQYPDFYFTFVMVWIDLSQGVLLLGGVALLGVGEALVEKVVSLKEAFEVFQKSKTGPCLSLPAAWGSRCPTLAPSPAARLCATMLLPRREWTDPLKLEARKPQLNACFSKSCCGGMVSLHGNRTWKQLSNLNPGCVL